MSKERYNRQYNNNLEYYYNIENQKLNSNGYRFYKTNGKYIFEEPHKHKSNNAINNYDITMLEIKSMTPRQASNGQYAEIYTCEVSWADTNNVILLDKNEPIPIESRTVQIELSLDTLEHTMDEQYIKCLMIKMLDMDRVKKYTDTETKQFTNQSTGRRENIQCGNYIGYISDTYNKMIDSKIAKVSAEQSRYQSLMEELNREQSIISQRKAEINKKNMEIHELEEANNRSNIKIENIKYELANFARVEKTSTNNPSMTHDDDERG